MLISRKKQIESLTAILAYLDEHYAENITLDMLAQQFRYNKFYFSKLFNSCVNDNLKNYVNGIRIKKFVETYSLDPAQNITRLALDLGLSPCPPFTARSRGSITAVRRNILPLPFSKNNKVFAFDKNIITRYIPLVITLF